MRWFAVLATRHCILPVPPGLASAEDFADRCAGNVARGLAGREETAVKRDALGEGRLTIVTGNLGFVDVIEEVQLVFLL